MPSKYSPLEHYLKNLPLETKEITLSFQMVEEILQDYLPPSAHRHSAWWNNELDGNHVHAHSWMNAGWRVETASLSGQWVRFFRSR